MFVKHHRVAAVTMGVCIKAWCSAPWGNEEILKTLIRGMEKHGLEWEVHLLIFIHGIKPSLQAKIIVDHYPECSIQGLD